MELTAEYWIEAHREVAWRALNDPAYLIRCIDGCQSFEGRGARYRAVVKTRTGPIPGVFDVDLEIINPIAPRACSIAAQIKGGAAGFARGTAHVSLAEEGDRTSLLYKLEGQVGNLERFTDEAIAQAAKQMADDFFARLNALLAAGGPPPPSADRRKRPEPLYLIVAGAAAAAIIACVALVLLR